jgi:drug/metabolite transporter (DMT)-like permease
MTANVLYLLATRGGDLSVVAPIAALYPVTTVILALIIEHERLRGIQLAGLTLAVAALVLVSR